MRTAVHPRTIAPHSRRGFKLWFAWGPKDSGGSRAGAAFKTIRSDSLALDLPGEVLTEGGAFGHAFSK